MIAEQRRVGLWIGFAILLTVGFTALAVVSVSVRRLEQAEWEARRAAFVEENMRLSLWRIDTLLAPLIAQESARSVSNFLQTSANEAKPEIVERFERLPSSPSEPKNADAAVPRSTWSASEARQSSVSQAEFEKLWKLVASATHFDSNRSLNEATAVINGVDRSIATNDSGLVPNSLSRGEIEFAQRSQNIATLNMLSHGQSIAMDGVRDLLEPTSSPMVAIWESNRMMLVRHATKNGRSMLQGCRLNWDSIRKKALVTIIDLLPNADLVPIESEVGRSGPDMLATLPVRLIPGALDHAIVEPRFSIPLMLAIAWGGALLAAIAGAFLLWGVFRLSERRAAFVAAVTHELRTPLTTFQLYTEMLSHGMIHDESTRQSYLTTLHDESLRLNHLVENVLAYARLERGRDAGPRESVRIEQVLERLETRLRRLTDRAGMELRVDLGSAKSSIVEVQLSLVEQILVNLIDNSCKYANQAENKQVRLAAESSNGSVSLIVQDFGPGFSVGTSRMLPFRKTVQQAAESAPGIGLGLALSRRLAKSLGGELSIESTESGAKVRLTLPVAHTQLMKV